MKCTVPVVPLLLLLLLGCSEDHPVAPEAVDTNQGPLFSETVFTGAFAVGGFDAARGGLFALYDGAWLDEARGALVGTYSGVSFTAIPEVTTDVLGGLDVVVFSSASSHTSHIVELSGSEQAALLSFVADGGCAVLFPDNDSFGGSITTPAVNASLLDPFGMVIDGTYWTWITATVTDPTASPVTDGPFGSVSSFVQLVPGALTDVGPHGTALATNGEGVALAVVEPGTIGTGSGPVVVFSDVVTVTDAYFGSTERTLWLNTIDYCLTPASPDEQVESIKSDVEDLADAGRLNKGESGSLTAKLSLAQKRISEGKDNAATNILEAFSNQVEALVNSGRLTPEEGQALIDAAQNVIAGLSD